MTDAGTESHNALADIKIKDVLAEVNGIAKLDDRTLLTTGAFYQIWSDQTEFQRELLTHLMNQIAMPGLSAIEAVALQLISDGESPHEVLRRVADLDFRASRESPELFLALGLGALVPAEMVRRAQLDANRRYVSVLSNLLDNLIRYDGRRLLPDRTMTDLIWAIEALEVGYLLRWRTHPDLPEQKDSRGWTAFSTAFVGVVHAFTEVVSQHEPH